MKMIDLGRPCDQIAHIKDWCKKKFLPLAKATGPHYDMYITIVMGDNCPRLKIGFESDSRFMF